MQDPIVQDDDHAADLLKQVQSGRSVAVICRAQFAAKAEAQAFYAKYCDDWNGDFALSLHSIKHKSGGRIEFLWTNSSSGRRTDDFDSVRLSQQEVSAP